MLIYLIAITRNGAYRYGDFKPGGVLYSNVLFGGFSETEAKGKDAEFGYTGLGEFRSLRFLPFEPEKLEEAIEKIRDLIVEV